MSAFALSLSSIKINCFFIYFSLDKAEALIVSIEKPNPFCKKIRNLTYEIQKLEDP